ncbi:MAG: alpha/beta hydrolase [Terracidiphilus sp.]
MRAVQAFARWGLACVIVWLILCAGIGIYSLEGALHPGRHPLTESDEESAQAIALQDRAALADVEIAADDGATLSAWTLEPKVANGDAVILLHGQGDNREGMLGNADMLLRHGYSVLLPDARAHGKSGGAIATYGVKEAGDVRRWYDWLERTQAPHCIDGLGDSMGAAILLSSLAAEPGFCAVSAESTFSTFQEAAYDRLGQEFGTGPWLGRTLLRPAIEAGLLYSRIRYGVDLESASPESAVVSSKVPVLLIHGLADRNLPPRHSELIKAANPAVELWEPAGVGHCGAASVAPAEYERHVVGWFESHDRSHANTASR